MAIVLGLALALHHDRAPAALVNFMGVYWILNGMVTFQLGLAAEGPRRRLALAAGAIGTVTGAFVLVADVGTTFLLAVLGVVIALTGVAHLLGGFELADRSGRRWRPLGRPRDWTRNDTHPDGGSPRFPLHLARQRLGASRRSGTSLRCIADAASVSGRFERQRRRPAVVSWCWRPSSWPGSLPHGRACSPRSSVRRP